MSESPVTMHLFRAGDEANITVLVEGHPKSPFGAHSSHQNFDRIVELASAGDPEVADLFDVDLAIQRVFERLNERWSYEDKQVYKDGDLVETAFSRQLLAFVQKGEPIDALLKFDEKLDANPSKNSREMAWAWLNENEFAITEEGNIIAYKGVNKDENGDYRSTFKGEAFVNDEPMKGLIRNNVGDTVTMPRSVVKDDPFSLCHTGLHVANKRFAQGFATHTVTVELSPRDIVSVPSGHGEKMRVCRYTVIEVTERIYGDGPAFATVTPWDTTLAGWPSPEPEDRTPAEARENPCGSTELFSGAWESVAKVPGQLTLTESDPALDDDLYDQCDTCGNPESGCECCVYCEMDESECVCDEEPEYDPFAGF